MAIELRKAIPVHHTGTSTKPWDAGANVKNIKDDADERTLRRMYAWVDPAGDPLAKSSYKFPHHEVDTDGNVGFANVKACQSGIGVLNGGMGGSTIPDADRQGVYNHLAEHLRDAEVEPPELKKSTAKKEIRLAELRAIQPAGDNAGMVVEGRAIVYATPTVIWEFDGIQYYEVIAKGALDGADMSDVPFKYNHSDNVMIMARTRNNTLVLTPDDQGLMIRATLADTTAGRDLYALIQRGDIDKMSFAFTVAEDSYNVDTRTRTIIKFKKIWDVSAVDTPAYDSTSISAISARSYFEKAEAELESEKLRKAAEAAQLRKRLLARTYL